MERRIKLVEYVSIKEQERKQREIVGSFTDILTKRPLEDNDFNRLKSGIKELAELECKAYRINLEFDEHSFSRNNSEEETLLGYSSEAEDITKDVAIWVNIEYFYQEYFKSDDMKRRIDGLSNMLLTVYHEIEHSKQNIFVRRSRLRPDVLELAYEMVVKLANDETFYNFNYDRLTSETYADIWGRFNMSDFLTGNIPDDIIQKLKETNQISDAVSLTNSKIGKVYRTGKLEPRDKFFRTMCDLYIKRYPDTLYNYPVLQKVYDEKGQRKDLEQIFEQMITDGRNIVYKYSSLDKKIENVFLLQQEYSDCTNFYFEIIGPLISKATEEDYKRISGKFGTGNLVEYLTKMEQYFNEKAEDKMDYIRFAKEMNMQQMLLEDESLVAQELKAQINAIVRFQNGCTFNKISDKLLREGGHIRGTRENLSPEIKKRRSLFANSLISIYDAFENENDYEKRAFSEESDIDEVIDALYFNRFEGFMKNKTVEEGKKQEFGNEEVTKIVQILKIAKILTRDSGKDYFNEFLTIPEVNKLLSLLEMDKSGFLKECIGSGIKKKKYPETEAEQGKYKEYIRGLKDNAEKIQLLNDELPKIKQRAKESRCVGRLE